MNEGMLCSRFDEQDHVMPCSDSSWYNTQIYRWKEWDRERARKRVSRRRTLKCYRRTRCKHGNEGVVRALVSHKRDIGTTVTSPQARHLVLGVCQSYGTSTSSQAPVAEKYLDMFVYPSIAAVKLCTAPVFPSPGSVATPPLSLALSLSSSLSVP